MDEINTIPKTPALPPSQDYELLRKEGLAHIESLAHDLWTDYNAHDPGITILEALCFAITELGYRCGFDMKDLLAREGTSDQVLFTARDILTNNPLTIDDFRKLLIDIDGVHNAWLFAEDFLQDDKKNKYPVNEVPLYADCENDVLVTKQTSTPLFLSGLYQVLLDLDFDDRYGDLNNGDIIFSNPGNTNFKEGEFMLSAELAAWKTADFSFAAKAADTSVNNIAAISINPDGTQWICLLTLTDSSVLSFGISIPKKPSGKNVINADITDMISADCVRKLFDEYLKKISLARSIVRTAIRRLQERRNLCEDFLSVTTVDDEPIAFCFDVDVRPDADIEEVQAETFYAIENYLNPSVDFYSLKELLDKNIPVDDIFNGPVLTHGFIDTGQLEKTNLRSVVYTSDIINLLMDIEGVTAIRNFVMTKYGDDGKPVLNETGLKWCMEITPLHKPVLSAEKSKILLFKDQFPFLADYDEVHDTLLLLHAEHAKEKLNGFQQDIPAPAGTERDTLSFWPVQYDLPQTYGTGQYGLPANANIQRIAQQRELKGYLMFYEQLLADFFSQLTYANRLFSTADIKSTYYAQFLNEIKDTDTVYKPDLATALLKMAIDDPDSTKEVLNGWQQLYEPKRLFEQRRSRFLDHLLARFAESFNDYALLMYRINYDEKTEEKISFSEMSASKTEVLKHYDEISRDRAKAFDYYPQKDDFANDTSAWWDTDNVSGLEKRISFLTGIKNYTRRFLYCIKNIEIICNEETVTENGNEIIKCYHTFSVTTPDGIKMISAKYEKKEDAVKAVADAIQLGADKTNYLFDTTDMKLKIIGHSNEVLLQSDTAVTYPDKNTAMQDADRFVAEFSKECNDPEGLHLVEHILLRPRAVTDGQEFKLMEVCLEGCDCPCEQDPYTFRASVVLPYWPGHFDNMAFREYFETKINEEAPAQVTLKVCWLSNDNMRKFEVRYKRWIETVAIWTSDRSQANMADFRNANDAMIDILKNLHSEYPLATLHDCEESKERSNVVVLGKTVLGTF